jgi:hypothetical protein
MLLTMSLTSCVSAQEMNGIPVRVKIPEGTPIHLRLAESVSSARARVGDLLDFIVIRDVVVGGFTIIHAGNMARGSISEVKGRRFLGIGGKVSLRLDSVELINGDRVGLRGKKEVKGASRTKLMIGGMIVTSLIFLPATPVFLLTRGHTSTALKSTEVTGQIDGSASVLSTGLQRPQEGSSELDELLNYLPPRLSNRDGREGDMLNLVFVAQPADLQEAFEHAGWVKTDNWKPAFVWHLFLHGTHDRRLPMASFYLFGRVQDYSYALPDPVAIVSRRHHIRIWKTDYTLDGTPLWIGAATHDVAIEIAKRGRLINHKIDPEVDAERDFIGVSLTEASLATGQQYLHSNAPVFEAQTSSGESYHSDSRILLLDLHQTVPDKIGLSLQSFPGVGETSLPMAAPAASRR